MVILSINFNHDGSAVLLVDGRIAGYVNTERFSRIKKHPGIREEELDEILDQAGIRIVDIDHVILVNHGINYPELEEKYQTDFKDTWLRFDLNGSQTRVTLRGHEFDCHVNPEHFLCHSAAAYYFSPFESAICFSLDPMGSGAFWGVGNRLEPIPFPTTLAGTIYNEMSIYLGFGGVFGAGKTMGLAPYGDHCSPDITAGLTSLARNGVTGSTAPLILRRLRELAEESPTMVRDGEQAWNATAAFIVQELLEIVLSRELDALFRLNARNGLARKQSAQPNLCLSGGTALNSVANQKCFSASRFSRLYLHPACGDDGTAIGAALHFWHHVLGNPKIPRTSREAMYGVRTYEDRIMPALNKFSPRIDWKFSDSYRAETAQLIAAGKIIAWFQGASEIGPRALGNRSILCDPSRPEMKDTLNSRVKFRENFRPFAPSILNEYAAHWFGLSDSPFMLRVASVLKKEVPAITHHDGTARIQTVSAADNPAYHALIEEFRLLTGVPLLLNTSFNIKGEPIVETPEDAIISFLDSDLDNLVFPGCIVSKSS